MGESQHWTIVLAAFCTQAMTHGFTGAMGVFYIEWKKAFADSGGSSAAIGWLATSILGVLLSTAPFSGALTHHIGVRAVVMFGGFLAATGLFVTSFAQSISLLFFSVPILTGLGCGLSYAASITILTQYFHKHFGFASGIASTGISCGMMILPIVVQALVDQYTWRNALMILSAVMANVMVCGAIMKPPKSLNTPNNIYIGHPVAEESDQSNETCAYAKVSLNHEGEVETVALNVDGTQRTTKAPSTSLFRVAIDSLGISLLWTNRVYLCLCPMFLCNGPAYATTVIYIKERTNQVGIPEFQSALLISVIGISGFVARAGHGRLIDRKIIHPAKLYFFANSIAAIAVPFIAICEHYAMFVLCAALVGFGAGLYIALNIYLVRHIVGVKRFPGGFGLALMLVAVSIMISVALAGYLLDHTGDYLAGFLYAGILQGMCGVVCLVNHFVWTRCYKDPRWPPPLTSCCGRDNAQ